jgi:phage shock protein PspC (stress-responsive transcriptional regulator)
MRIIWLALLLLPPNIGIIAYIVAWAVLPKSVADRSSAVA